jgi:L-amino acid N-acyltransferase YncA
MRNRIAAAVVLAMLTLAGCGGGDAVKTTGDGGTPSSGSSPTSTTTPAPGSKAEAAAKFTALRAAYLRSIQDLAAAVNTTPVDMRAVRAGAKKAAAGLQTEVSSFRGFRWPAEVQPEVTKYLRYARLGLKALKAAATAKTVNDLRRADQADAFRKMKLAEVSMRIKLGLASG